MYVALATNQFFVEHAASEWSADGLCYVFRIATDRDGAEVFAVVERQRAVRRPAETVRLLQYRIEHRRQIAGRGIDDLQYLRGRGLLLQRLARLSDQPRVLHCDDRLPREIL